MNLDARIVENRLIVRNKYPIGSKRSDFRISVVPCENCIHVDRVGQSLDDRCEIEEVVRNVECDNAIATEMLYINLHRFTGQKVNRDRVAGESIERKNIEAQGRLPTER